MHQDDAKNGKKQSWGDTWDTAAIYNGALKVRTTFNTVCFDGSGKTWSLKGNVQHLNYCKVREIEI